MIGENRGWFVPGLDEQILAQNPWWTDPAAIGDDRHLLQYRESGLHWTPPVLDVMPLRPGDTDTLRGPRQVGKTTSAKRLVQGLLERREPRVLYFSFDLVRDFREMPDVLARAKQLHPDPAGPWYMFLDEVTSVADWQVGIKYAWDQGLTRDDYLLLTGSSAHDLRRGAEQLPGRRGNGSDYLQLPMSFRDFAGLAAGIDVPAEAIPAEGCLTPDGRRLLAGLNLRISELQRAFDAYRRIGGFPAAVRDYLVGGVATASEVTIRTLWDAVAGDIARAGLDTVAALKLLEEVGVSLGSALKWSGAARAMDVSDEAARRYVERLAEAFQLLTVYFWDLGGKTLSPSRQRKVYYIDPLLASVPSRILQGARGPSDDAVVENLVAVALFRSAARTLVQAGAVPGAIAYWRSSNDREIDFVVPTAAAGLRFPVEVKADSRTSLAHARLAIRNAFGRGLVVSRSTFDWAEDVAILPAPVLLAALDEKPRRELFVA